MDNYIEKIMEIINKLNLNHPISVKTSLTCDTVLRYTSKGARFTLIVLKPYIF